MSNVEKVSWRKKVKSPNLKKDDGGYRVHKPYDKYFKNVMSIAGEGFMNLIGYPIKIKQFHNTEKINEISGELHIDNLIESEEPKMYINEFHTGHISEKDLRRYGSYQVLVFKETGLETIVTIISLDAKEDSDKLYGFGKYFNEDSESNINDLNSLKIEYGFTPHVKSLTSLDLSLNLNIMDKIIETKKKPDEYDLAILFIIPFMTVDEEKRKELVFKTDEMASKLNIVDYNLLIDIKNNQRLLATQVLNDDELKEFMRLRRMLSEEDIHKLDMHEEKLMKEIALENIEEKIKNKVINQVKDEVKAEVKDEVKAEVKDEVKAEVMEEGKELGEEKVIRKLLEDGFNVEDVLKYTSLNKSRIIALSNTIVLK